MTIYDPLYIAPVSHPLKPGTRTPLANPGVFATAPLAWARRSRGYCPVIGRPGRRILNPSSKQMATGFPQLFTPSCSRPRNDQKMDEREPFLQRSSTNCLDDYDPNPLGEPAVSEAVRWQLDLSWLWTSTKKHEYLSSVLSIIKHCHCSTITKHH